MFRFYLTLISVSVECERIGQNKKSNPLGLLFPLRAQVDAEVDPLKYLNSLNRNIKVAVIYSVTVNKRQSVAEFVEARVDRTL